MTRSFFTDRIVGYAILAMSFLFVLPVQGQTVKVIRVNQLQQLMQEPGDQWRVINFWATWCGPCVKEIPDFEKARKQFQADGVQFVYVSLDFPNQHLTKVTPFVVKRKMGGRLFLLDPGDDDQWIDKIEKKWDGAIPATFIINQARQYREFIGHEMDFEALESKLNAVLGKAGN